MSQETRNFYLELPGQEIKGSFSQNNRAVLHNHRDLFIKIEDPNISKLRVTCSGEDFYMPKLGHLMDTHEFAPGEEVHCWLGKSFDKPIHVDQLTDKGWRSLVTFPVATIDPNPYPQLTDLPAPISIVSKNIPDPGMASSHVPYSGTATSHKSPKFDHVWLRNLLADEAAQERNSPHCLIFEPDDDFMHRYGRNAVLNREYNAGDYGNPVVRDLVLGVFSQAADKGRLFQDLQGVSMRLTRVQTANGLRVFIIFNGYAGLRDVVIASRYRVGLRNTVTPITVGLGTLVDSARQAGQGIIDMARPKTATGAFFLFALALDTMEWIAEGGEDALELIAKLLNTTIVTGLALLLAPFLAKALFAGISAVFGAAAITVSLVAIGGAAIFIGTALAIGYIFYSIGAKDFIYNHLSEVAEFYKKRAEEEPDWEPWWL